MKADLYLLTNMQKKQKNFGQKLLVEVKITGKEPENMAEIVANKFKELGVEKDFMVVSFDLKLMEEVKKLIPDIKTGYIIPFQFGKFSNNNVDFFAIRRFFLLVNTLVEQAKSQNKSVYVWTINDPSLITKYLQSPANGIITDEPVQVRETKEKLEKNNFISGRINTRSNMIKFSNINTK